MVVERKGGVRVGMSSWRDVGKPVQWNAGVERGNGEIDSITSNACQTFSSSLKFTF